MSLDLSSLETNLSNATPFFGLRLWMFILICIAALFVLIPLLVCFCFICCRRRRSSGNQFATLKPDNSHSASSATSSSLDRRLLSRNGWDIELANQPVPFSGQWSAQASARHSNLTDLGPLARCSSMVFDTRGGKQIYTLRDIEAATNGFSDENVLGSGDSGIVYLGVLLNGTRVAVKKLLYDSGKVENFIAQVETIGSASHRNLVKLLGFCTEGDFRMLVYEYVDNDNLYQWLHRCTRRVSPLTWSIRMNIIQAAAKGLSYMHEDIEPKVVHQHLKSSNILLDQQWNPKISDLGIGEVLGPGWSHLTTSSRAMRGYVAPEYAYTGVLDEKSDVYSFGILLMEIITGKTPVEYSTEPEAEVYLIDWLKSMVAEQNFDHVVDPKMPDMPSLKELKRVVLISLRCVDSDFENRPTMGDVIHMFEPLDLLLSHMEECYVRHETSRCNSLKDNHDFIIQDLRRTCSYSSPMEGDETSRYKSLEDNRAIITQDLRRTCSYSPPVEGDETSCCNSLKDNRDIIIQDP